MAVWLFGLATGIPCGMIILKTGQVVTEWFHDRREERDHDAEWGGGLNPDEDVQRITIGLTPITGEPVDLTGPINPIVITPSPLATMRRDFSGPRHAEGPDRIPVRTLIHDFDGTREIPTVIEPPRRQAASRGTIALRRDRTEVTK